MKLNEFLTESEQRDIQQLEEGVGSAIGKAVGGVAKGVGAVAGGVAGIGRAFKKGFASGKATVAGDPDPYAQDVNTPTTQTKTNTSSSTSGGTSGGTSSGTSGSADASTPSTADASTQSTAEPTPKQQQQSVTAYKRIQQQLGGLSKKQQQQLLTTLKKDVTAFDAKKQKTAKPTTKVQPTAKTSTAVKSQAGTAASTATTGGGNKAGIKAGGYQSSAPNVTFGKNKKAAPVKPQVKTTSTTGSMSSQYQTASKEYSAQAIHEDIMKQMEYLEEGPIGAVGAGLGKVAQGAGAVAGGVAGGAKAFRKSRADAKDKVGKFLDPSRWGEDDDDAPTQSEPAQKGLITSKLQALKTLEKVSGGGRLTRQEQVHIKSTIQSIENGNFDNKIQNTEKTKQALQAILQRGVVPGPQMAAIEELTNAVKNM